MNNVIKIHTEFCLVSNACIKDKPLYEQILKRLRYLESKDRVPSFYHNHFVLECQNGIMIGINDGYASIGTKYYSVDGRTKTLDVDFVL